MTKKPSLFSSLDVSYPGKEGESGVTVRSRGRKGWTGQKEGRKEGSGPWRQKEGGLEGNTECQPHPPLASWTAGQTKSE